MAEDSAHRLLLARHPETVANREHRYIGDTDSPFTPRGCRQSAALARCIERWEPDAVLSSPARRAAEPAKAAAEALGMGLRLEPVLHEVGWGEAEGLTYDEIALAGILMDYLGGPAAGEIARGGETWQQFEERIGRVAELTSTAGRRVAVVTHGGVIRALLVRVLGLPAEAAWRFAIAPASIAVVTLSGGTGTLEAFGLRPSQCGRGSRRS